MNELDFRLILERFNLSPEGYRKVRKGVQKRIIRHMAALRCPTTAAYLERLDADPVAQNEARRLMDVSISRFFRDGPVWKILEEEHLPLLIREHPGGLRVWSAGCALGQEVFSFEILWAILAGKTAAMPPLELWATDVNPDYLERAIEGIYPAGALARVPAEARARFFHPVGNARFRAIDSLREGIRWRVHDLSVDAPPARDFQVIFFRNNLLTYYRDEIVEAALPAIADSLVPGGVLVIGRKERLPDFLKGFTPHAAAASLYKKQGSGIFFESVEMRALLEIKDC
jgi:chemotaxis methyl-accepting protein methylase